MTTCELCGKEISRNSSGVWHKVSGWEKRRPGGGTNHVALRKVEDVFRCEECMQKLLAGFSKDQEELF